MADFVNRQREDDLVDGPWPSSTRPWEWFSPAAYCKADRVSVCSAWLAPTNRRENPMSSSRRRSISSLTSRMGGWLPTDHAVLGRWLGNTIEVAEKNSAPFHPVVAEFQALIESDPVLYMYFIRMFEEQPRFASPSGSGDVKIQNYQQMLVVINHVLTTAPEYDDTGMVGFPINAILDFPMITSAGLAAFRLQSLNEMLRKVLAVWTEFLDDAKSLYVLNDTPTGWLSPAAKAAIHLDEFQTNPDLPYLGFKSWNDFFIRQFKAGPAGGAPRR